MTIPKLTPYTGQVANPDGSQTQTEFTQNMFDQLSYEAQLATELDATIDSMNQAVTDVENNTAAASAYATAAAASANYERDFISVTTSAIKGKSYSFEGSTWLCLNNTTSDPSIDSPDWRKVVSVGDVNQSQEELINGKIFPESGAVKNGGAVPSGITHLRVLIGGEYSVVTIHPISDGVVTNLTEIGATIGGVDVEFSPAITTFTKKINTLTSLNGVDRFELPASTISEASTKTITDGQKLFGADTLTTRIEFKDGVDGLFYDASASEPNNGEISYLSLINLGGKDSTSDSSGIYFDSLSGNNPQRNHHHHLAISGWGYAGVRYSGGWGNILSQSRIVGNDTGIKWDTSFLSGWAGSGQLTYCNYIAGNNVGYYNVNGWNNVSICDVIQDNGTGLIQSGNNYCSIGQWHENNTQSPLFTRGAVNIVPRGLSYRNTLDTDLTVPDEAIVSILNSGISVFRDQVNPMFEVGGRGVVQSNNILPTTPQRQRNFQRTQSATYSTVWEVCSTSNFYDHANTQEANEQLNDIYKTSSIRLEGNGSGANGGTGNGRIVFSSGTYKRDGTTTPTDYRDQWEIAGDGDLNPFNDADQDFGDTTHRINDAFLVNNPTIGSDVRIKPVRNSIPQELCDFVLTIESECYKLAVNESGRDHFGIVIDDKFLSEISDVVNVDGFAPLCKSVFKDANGNPIESHLWGKREKVELDFDEDTLELYCIIDKGDCNVWVNGEVVGSSGEYRFDITEINDTQENPSLPVVEVEYGGVRLGDLWQVRYTEWLVIVTEAQRRLLLKQQGEIEQIKSHLGI